jgi:hypothetical protein
MRRDIAKVVFERPKSARTWASKTPRPVPDTLEADGEAHNELAQNRRVREQKRTNPRLQAIDHFLLSNVGRPWDKVWAEICQTLDSRNTLGAEIRAFVRCTVSERKPAEGFYVHPKSGLLLRVPDPPRQRGKKS